MIDRLAWVTAAEARGHDDDERLILPALRHASSTRAAGRRSSSWS
jgi:hypothetical protein